MSGKDVTGYLKLFLNFEDIVAVNRHLLSTVMAMILMQRCAEIRRGLTGKKTD